MLAAAAVSVATAASPQVAVTPTEQEVLNCIAEERQRDRLALRRQGVRTRDESELRAFCQADVAARFDARILGRPMPPRTAIPYGGAGDFRPAPQRERFSVSGPWWMVGAETQPQTRYLYFVSGADIERNGDIGEGWLAVYFEHGLNNGATNKLSRVRVDCRTGEWADEQALLRDRDLWIVGEQVVSDAWNPPVTAPNSPIARLIGTVCRGEEAGTPVSDERGPPYVAEMWFRNNPR